MSRRKASNPDLALPPHEPTAWMREMSARVLALLNESGLVATPGEVVVGTLTQNGDDTCDRCGCSFECGECGTEPPQAGAFVVGHTEGGVGYLVYGLEAREAHGPHRPRHAAVPTPGVRERGPDRQGQTRTAWCRVQRHEPCLGTRPKLVEPAFLASPTPYGHCLVPATWCGGKVGSRLQGCCRRPDRHVATRPGFTLRSAKPFTRSPTGFTTRLVMTYLEVVLVLDREDGTKILMLEEVDEPQLGRLITSGGV